MNKLEGKISLITGASRGIGRAIALDLAKAGSDIAVNYYTRREPAEAVAAQIQSMGRKAIVYKADISNPEETEQMVDRIFKELGPVQILVNNAGVTMDKSFAKMDYEMWHEVLKIDLSGPAMITQRLLETMTESGWGRIINIASIVGQTGNFGQANYAAAKGGLISLTKTLARELAGKNITVNAIAPGFIETDMTAKIPEGHLQNVCSMTPMGRLGKPEEVATAVGFLASPQASFITGEVLAVNGGMYM